MFGCEWRLDPYYSTLRLHSFHVDSVTLNQSAGPQCKTPDQKLLYLFTQKLVLLKVNQSESECILVCVHAHTGTSLGGYLWWGRLILTEHLEYWNS